MNLAQENDKIKVELEMMKGAVTRLELAKKGLESEVSTLTEDVRSSDKSLRESMAEQRRLQEAMAEVQDSAMQDRKELEKWKQASEVVQAKLGKIYQILDHFARVDRQYGFMNACERVCVRACG